MVIDDVHAKKFHQFIKGQRRIFLEPGIRIAAVPHAVNDFAAVIYLVEHGFNDAAVVLQIGVNRHIQVGVGIIHAGNNRFLMTKVARQADARKNPLPGGGFFYQRPGFVAASVVYKTDFAVRMHFFAFYQLFQQRADDLYRLRQHR